MVYKWATNVKNLLTTGATNMTFLMILDDLYCDIAQKAANEQPVAGDQPA